jgi:hypothetical protein
MKLPGRYKGNRRTWQGRTEKIVANCAICPWKMNPQKAEERYLRHLATVHPQN